MKTIESSAGRDEPIPWCTTCGLRLQCLPRQNGRNGRDGERDERDLHGGNRLKASAMITAIAGITTFIEKTAFSNSLGRRTR